jgi:broad specificity phosphatase PhoE
MVHSSDLLRCVETAVIALPGVDLRREPRLRERGDGPSPQPVNLSFLSSEQIDALVKNPVGQAPESTPEFRARLREWLFGLPNQGRVLAFAHQLVIQEIVRLWSAVGNPRDTIEISNASITRLERENGVSRLVCLNDIQHLQP